MGLIGYDITHGFNTIIASKSALLTCTVIASSAAVAASILTYQVLLQRRTPHEHPPGSTARSSIQNKVEENEVARAARLAARTRAGDYDDELILEQLARNQAFLTPKGLDNLRSSFVVIVGCGGVGSHVAAALARSGVSRIRLIDFDQVTLSSLNRHALATLADVGSPKVHCIRKRLEQIAPWIEFDCRNELFSRAVADAQLGPWNCQPTAGSTRYDLEQPAYIVDAIDNIDSKVELLHYCHSHSLRAISSMGAGCKSDPTRLFIGDISQSTDDALSRNTRRRLRALGVASGIPVVFSTEKPSPGKARLLPLPEAEFVKGRVGELGVLPNFRVRILPVLGTMPAIFGLCIANHIMLDLASYPHDYLAAKSRDKMYDGILASLQGTEERLARAAGFDGTGLRLPITQDDVGYLVEEVFRGRSVISGLPTRLALIRWQWDMTGLGNEESVDETVPGQKSARLRLGDLVCMTKDEATRHEKEILITGKSLGEVYEESVITRVQARQEEEKEFAVYR